MKITIEEHGNKIIKETDSVMIIDVLNDIIEVLLGAGFQEESIKEAIIEKAEEYTKE